MRLPREASGLRTAKDNERFKWRVGWTLPPAIPSILLRYSTGPSKTLRRRNQSQLSLLPTARTGLAVEPPRTLDSWPGICAQRPRPIGESSNTFIKRIHLLSSIMIVWLMRIPFIYRINGLRNLTPCGSTLWALQIRGFRSLGLVARRGGPPFPGVSFSFINWETYCTILHIYKYIPHVYLILAKASNLIASLRSIDLIIDLSIDLLWLDMIIGNVSPHLFSLFPLPLTTLCLSVPICIYYLSYLFPTHLTNRIGAVSLWQHSADSLLITAVLQGTLMLIEWLLKYTAPRSMVLTNNVRY